MQSAVIKMIIYGYHQLHQHFIWPEHINYVIRMVLDLWFDNQYSNTTLFKAKVFVSYAKGYIENSFVSLLQLKPHQYP